MLSGGLFGTVKESSVKLLWKCLHCRGKRFIAGQERPSTGRSLRPLRIAPWALAGPSSRWRTAAESSVSAFVYDDYMPRAFVEPQDYRYDYVYVG